MKIKRSPLKMHMIERIIWFFSIAFMSFVLIWTNVNDHKTEQAIVQPIPAASMPTMLVQVNTLNGYYVSTDIGTRYLTISKNSNNLSVEIQEFPFETIDQYLQEHSKNGKTPVVHELKNGWKYIYSESWDPSPDSKVPTNTRRIFFNEKEGKLVLASQFDYTGGKFDKEVDEVIGGTVLCGSSWGGC